MANRESQHVEKLEWHLLPLDAMAEVVKVLMDGKKNPEYGANNWRTPPYFKREEVFNSAQRHLTDRFFAGEVMDKKSGRYAMAHLVCNALFALYYDIHGLWADESEIVVKPAEVHPRQQASAPVDPLKGLKKRMEDLYRSRVAAKTGEELLDVTYTKEDGDDE